MAEIIPGIYQLQIPIPDNPLGHTNSYLVRGDNEYLLIDPGINTDEAFDTLKRGLSEIGIAIKAITRIIATHAHGDHYGLAERMKQLSQARILLHDKDRNLMNPWGLTMDELMRHIVEWFQSNGVPASEASLPPEDTRNSRRPPPTSPDVILHGGETISTGIFNLQVIWTPGHSPGHICLYEPNHKILFAGDHILPVITPNISLYPQSPANPLGDFLNSLNRVKQLDVNLVLPAHEHLFTDLVTRVEEIIQHHKNRNSEILETLKPEPKTAYQISKEITWMPELGGVSFQDLEIWNKRMAVSEAMAHLEAMRVEGRVDKFSRDSIICYQCA
ncbi:MBL fold metallo-hydrolase [Chloroflexota bacterium]